MTTRIQIWGFFLSLLAGSALAQTTWDGGGANNNWTAGANWNNDIAPFNPSLSVLEFEGTVRLTPNLNQAWVIQGLQVNSSPGANAFSLSGNRVLTLNAAGLANLDDDVFTFNGPDIVLGASQTWNAASGGFTLNSGSPVNTAGYNLTFSGGGGTTISSIISGSGNLIHSGGGTLSLGGNNAFTGTVSIQSGRRLRMTHRNALGNNSSGTTIASGGTLEIAVGGTISEPLTLSGSGQTGAGAMHVTAGSSTWAGSMTMQGMTTINIDDGTALRINGVISDGSYSGIIKNGGGTLTLGAANAFQAPVTINGGVLNIRNSTALGSSTWGNTIDGGTLEIQGNLAVNEGSFTIHGQGYEGLGAIRNVSGNSSYSGTLSVGSAATVATDGGSLTLSGLLSLGADLTFTGSNNANVTGTSYGSGRLIKEGTGTLTLSGSSGHSHSGQTIINEGTLVLNKSSGANTFNGAFIVGDGSGTDVLRLSAADQIANHLSVEIYSSGTFNLNGFDEQIRSISMNGGMVSSGAGTLTLSAGSGAITVAADAATATMAGKLTLTGYQPVIHVGDGADAVDMHISAAINASKGFVKEGAGTLQVSGFVTTGSDPFNDRIRISEGTLLLGASDIIGNDTPINLDGGTLATGGFSDSVGSLTLADNSRVDLGGGDSALEFADSSSVSWTGNKALVIENWDGYLGGGGNDQVRFGSGSGLTAVQLSQISFYNPAGLSPGVYLAGLLGSGELVPVPIPEPASVLVAVLLAGVILWRERGRFACLRRRIGP